MRNFVLRLFVVAVFLSCFLDLFIGNAKGDRSIWILCVLGAFFLIEAIAKLAMWIYMGRG